VSFGVDAEHAAHDKMVFIGEDLGALGPALHAASPREARRTGALRSGRAVD
jgi:hypothetical protein